MSNLLTNPGAEQAAPPPTLEGSAQISSAFAYTGAKSFVWSQWRTTVLGSPFEAFGNIVWSNVPVNTGADYTFSFYLYRSTTGERGSGYVNIQISHDGGPYATVKTVNSGDLANDTWTLIQCDPVTATGSTLSVRVRSPAQSATDNRITWVADDAVLEAPAVAQTENVKTALVADLEAIDGTGSFSTTVVEVGTEPKRADLVAAPAAFVIAGDYFSDPEDNTTQKGLATQTFVVQLVVKSATPYADIDSFFDDVRNAIERSTSNLVAVAGVHKVDVVGSDEVLVDSDVGERLAIRQITVAVEYSYTRGAA